ncbi:membrane protein [Actinorhabdospora filicis]|uniref:Membrane protein n=1 Tax=Actinorhabdospora filicis TaxID=1785913 RepID=A0A9W6SHB0_9ACTN|nr:MMPL family transporter [Actinorhabdospora filicis]GLZ75429.1 membrane protein [Actinorhabdospora filicis]
MGRSVTTKAAQWSARHPWWAIGLWLAFVVVTFMLGSRVETKQLENGGVGESHHGREIANEGKFDDPDTDNVLITPTGAWDEAAAKSAAEDVLARLKNRPEVAKAEGPVPSRAAEALLVPIEYNVVPDGGENPVLALRQVVADAQAAHPDLRMELIGNESIGTAIDELVDGDLGRAGMISLPLTLVILLLAFGAIVAAGVPLLLALSAVASAMGLWAVASQVVPDPGSAMHVILLIGMAVGVDYSLFYLKREREERAKGRKHLDAVAIAAETSGRSVVVSGFAVIVSMAGLYLAGDPVFNGLGTGAIIVVAVAMLGSLTVLPAVLAKLGRAVDRPRVPFIWRLTNRAHTPGHTPKLWPTLLKPALRAPRTTLLLALAALAALAVFAVDLNPKNSELEDFPPDMPMVQAYDRLTTAFPSEGQTHLIAVKAPAAEAAEIKEQLISLSVKAGGDPLFSPDAEPKIRQSASMTITTLALPVPFDSSQPGAAESLEKLRNELIPATVGTIGDADVAVTGGIAYDIDYVAHQKTAMPLVIGFVVLLTFLMMIFAFKSVVVAAVAALLNMVSAAAAFGVLVLVFQKTWAEKLLDFHSNGHVVTWVPLFLFVILFGLSMDYHVFVVSRIREGVERGMETREAVAYGITRTAGVVTSAAVVMVAVFGVFATLSMNEMKQIGVGLSVAILIDATIVRIFLLPSLMALLGRANWWPSKLGRAVPSEAERERELVTAGH